MSYRNTKQRELILEELRRLKSHPTATALYDGVRRRLPSISLGTVYRNLEQMAQAGVIRKVELPGAPARYDATTDPHDHIRCISCGRVDDLPAVPLDRLLSAPQDWAGYELVVCRIELLGVCPTCRAQRERFSKDKSDCSSVSRGGRRSPQNHEVRDSDSSRSV